MICWLNSSTIPLEHAISITRSLYLCSDNIQRATPMGLEPTTPTVTGWCSNLLSYEANSLQLKPFRGTEQLRTAVVSLLESYDQLPVAIAVHASAPHRGFEPRTDELTARCSAVELVRKVSVKDGLP